MLKCFMNYTPFSKTVKQFTKMCKFVSSGNSFTHTIKAMCVLETGVLSFQKELGVIQFRCVRAPLDTY